MSEDDGTGKGSDDGKERPGRPQLDEDDFPRSRFRISPQQVIPIFALIITLFAVITMRKGCADGVATMFKVMGTPDGGGPSPPPRPPQSLPEP